MTSEKLVKINGDLTITEKMVVTAFEEMLDRWYMPFENRDTLHEWVNEYCPHSASDECGSPTLCIGYGAYLTFKCLNLYRNNDYECMGDEFTNAERGMWYLIWNATKDLEFKGSAL